MLKIETRTIVTFKSKHKDSCSVSVQVSWKAHIQCRPMASMSKFASSTPAMTLVITKTDRVLQSTVRTSILQLQFNPSNKVTLALFFVYLDLASATEMKLAAMCLICSHVKPSKPSFCAH